MVIEYGEECDCGYPQDCQEQCCNPATCKLKNGTNCRLYMVINY